MRIFSGYERSVADQNYAWINSWKFRVCAAIREINTLGWRLQLYSQLERPSFSEEVKLIIL
jgi:hypothetical protein